MYTPGRELYMIDQFYCIQGVSDAKVHLHCIHYENTPIQIYRKFHLQKPNIFR